MKKQPLISVIVPVYHAELTIRRCVRSIQNQSYDNIEVLLIINGILKDRTLEICQELSMQDGRIKVFQISEIGAAAARNYGIVQAKGDFLGFVDSDDWIEPTMYEKLYAALNKGEADISVCRYLRERRNSIRECGKYYTGIVTSEAGLRQLISDKIISAAWNKLFKRQLFDGIRFPEIPIYEDVAIMHRLFAKAEKIVLISDLEYHYMMHPGSLITKKDFEDRIVAIDVMHQRYDFIKNYFPAICDEMLPAIYGAYVTMAAAAIRRFGIGRKKQEILRGTLPLLNTDAELLEKLSGWQRCCLFFFSKNNYPADCIGLMLEYIRRKSVC